MRIAIGGLAHETNTFCAALTEVNEFKDREWTHGDALVAQWPLDERTRFES